MRFCLQLGLRNPPKIYAKSISRVSWKFDAILVGFFLIFLRFPSLRDTQNLAKTPEGCSKSHFHHFRFQAPWKASWSRFRLPFWSDFGAIFVSKRASKNIQTFDKFLIDFFYDFGSNLTSKMPPSWANLGTSGVHFCASAAKPARHGSRKAPRPPKTPSRPRFFLFFNNFWHDFLTHFWTRCLQNVLDHFSGKSAMQPVSEKSPPRFFPACVQELSHNTSKIRWSWQFFYNRQNSGGRRWLAKRLQYFFENHSLFPVWC